MVAALPRMFPINTMPCPPNPAIKSSFSVLLSIESSLCLFLRPWTLAFERWPISEFAALDQFVVVQEGRPLDIHEFSDHKMLIEIQDRLSRINVVPDNGALVEELG